MWGEHTKSQSTTGKSSQSLLCPAYPWESLITGQLRGSWSQLESTIGLCSGFSDVAQVFCEWKAIWSFICYSSARFIWTVFAVVKDPWLHCLIYTYIVWVEGKCYDALYNLTNLFIYIVSISWNSDKHEGETQGLGGGLSNRLTGRSSKPIKSDYKLTELHVL